MCSSSTEVEETTRIDDYLLFLERSGVGEILRKIKPTRKPEGGRPEINRYDLFAKKRSCLTSGIDRFFNSPFFQRSEQGRKGRKGLIRGPSDNTFEGYAVWMRRHSGRKRYQICVSQLSAYGSDGITHFFVYMIDGRYAYGKLQTVPDKTLCL